ncbi:MAG: UbiA family prenyltransferase [Candidatus Devosia phytovorans]|uniref:UbiA family prenyltransferase n=1 Tax=Candidatus Devosia phytovorans TaxID=3121372 RepID=A0AAJ5VS42_9HYPH|nr:UbiA family prenyltransferase [Devosia sp.]WEK03704.1 MAG: UbiA family prenyltransferase [Devosia sp.]
MALASEISPLASVEQTSDTVLVVDLDHTLCKTDTLHEALIAMALKSPIGVAKLLAGGTGDKAAFKRSVADNVLLAPGSLVYNEDVLDVVRESRQAGRRTALVSASDQRQVEAIADHLGLFDDVIGTGGEAGRDVNLGGKAKAAALTTRYGNGGFDYIGDALTDLEVWQHARRAYGVNLASRTRRAAAQRKIDVIDIGEAVALPARIKPYIRAMRPHQWSKNVLLFLPLLASHNFGQFPAVLAAFVCFCLTASAVYVINDLIDIPSDRAHQRKRLRPFASGALSARQGLIMAAVLLLASAALAIAFTPHYFIAMLAAYFAATFAYSTWLKRKLLVDVIALAGLYTIRIIAGGVAAQIMLSHWLLAFSMFLFFSLATIKRQTELIAHIQQGKDRAPGRGYFNDDLSVIRSMAVSSGHAAILVLALYVADPDTRMLYAAPEVIWLICPLMFYWLGRMEVMTHRGHMEDDPIVFAMRDRISLIVGALAAVIMLVAVRGW